MEWTDDDIDVERLEDERTLLMMRCKDIPPHGKGMSFGETRRVVNNAFPELPPVSRNTVQGRVIRVLTAIAESERSE